MFGERYSSQCITKQIKTNVENTDQINLKDDNKIENQNERIQKNNIILSNKKQSVNDF